MIPQGKGGRCPEGLRQWVVTKAGVGVGHSELRWQWWASGFRASDCNTVGDSRGFCIFTKHLDCGAHISESSDMKIGQGRAVTAGSFFPPRGWALD